MNDDARAEAVEVAARAAGIAHSMGRIQMREALAALLADRPCDAEGCRGGQVQEPEWEGHTEPCSRCHGSGRLPSVAVLRSQLEQACWVVAVNQFGIPLKLGAAPDHYNQAPAEFPDVVPVFIVREQPNKETEDG